MQRIWTLGRYFAKSTIRSFAGVGLGMITLIYWLIFFHPSQITPDPAYFSLLLGVFGAVMSFIVTLVCASRANRADLYPWVVRLPSRVEFMTAVFVASILITFTLQFLTGGLALIGRPQLTIIHLLILPPVWGSLIIFGSILALHATDLVVNGWSRVYVFGILAILLFAQNIQNTAIRSLVINLNRAISDLGWRSINTALADYAVYLNDGENVNIVSRVFGLVFWPFEAIATAIANGYFTPAQALAPAVILLYATILFMLASDFFANKDLTFSE